jgi:predicted dehydrogenase
VVSPVSYGNQDPLWIEIDADDGSVAWSSHPPAELRITRRGAPTEMHTSRGHPDPVRGFLAEVYRSVAEPRPTVGYATFDDGLTAVHVAEAIAASARDGGRATVVTRATTAIGAGS